MRFKEHNPHNWIAQFLHAKPNDVTIKLHIQYCNKIAYSRSKSYQGTSFGMCNKHIEIVFWEKVFANMNFDIHDASQFKLDNFKGKTNTMCFEDGE